MVAAGPTVLAIDLGTGGPKVALVTTDGEIIGHEFEPVDLLLSADGGAEQDPAQWWQAISTAAKRLLGRRLVPAEHVVAISCTTQWMGTVPVDRDRRHLMNAIIWMDTRGAEPAARVTDGWPKIGGYAATKLWRWLRVTGGVPSRTGKDSLGHILYLQQHRPDVYERAYKFLEPMDYLNLRFTGRAVASYDTIAGHWLTDNRDLSNVSYDQRLIATAGVDRDKLPDLVRTGAVIGTLTSEVAKEFGLSKDVQVVTGMPDTESAAIGSGAVRDFEPHLYIGTSSWLTCHVPFKKTDIINSITTLPSGIPQRYLVATEQDTAGACLTTFRDQIVWPDDELSDGRAPADALERFNDAAQRVPPGSDNLIFTPWLNGERTPVEDHLVRGGFFNQSLRTTRAHMIRALFEGVAFNTRWMHGHVERFVKRRLDDIMFVGGGAASALWCQIHADVLDRSIRQVAEPRLANARGAAFAASVALGDLTFEDVRQRVQIVRTFAPNSDHRDVYDRLYREFRDIYKNNRRAYARINAAGAKESGG